MAELDLEGNSPSQEIIELLDSILQTATFDTDVWGRYTSVQLRQLYLSGSELNAAIVRSTRLQADQQALSELVQLTRSVLADYLSSDDDSIANKLATMLGGIVRITLTRYTEMLVQAAAILGSCRATQMLYEWADDQPIRYWRRHIIEGISVEGTLELDSSVRMTSLPRSSDEISSQIPHFVRLDYSETRYAGKVLLSVEHETSFLSKTSLEEQLFVEHSHVSMGIEGFYIEGFCEALALASNSYVSWLSVWSDGGDWNVLNIGGAGGISRDQPNGAAKCLSQGQLVHACELFALWKSRELTDRRLKVAVDRWIRSKRHGSTLTDKFIDLRIALEALYLADSSGESRFRVSSHGAWHLGEDYEERQTYQKILRGSYDLASKVVHAGEIEYSDNSLSLLDKAQDLCRKGILKRLRESEEPKWNELMLGKEVDATYDT